MEKDLFLRTQYITLGQFLKITGIIDSGGRAKWFLQENKVLVNDEAEARRGRKLRAGDKVIVPDAGTFIMRSKQQEK
ncbi:S4 domain-containing protein YaaA [Liquorilactobacillus uvarum]|uniref:S4 domain-containing protein YaaA n=1 Tax=Liquorilactobacillus uvarum TaxID=303240 RepID=UPI00070B783A|nr:S4 domain-containing protein YaaA [Liquorilactobacillus uvarum]